MSGGVLLKNLNLLCIRNTFSNLNNAGLLVNQSASTSQKKVFSSQSNETSKDDSQLKVVQSYLSKHSIRYYDAWNSIKVNGYCMKSAQANNDPIHISKTNGDFFCTKCKSSGDFDKFKQLNESKSLCKLDLLIMGTTANGEKEKETDQSTEVTSESHESLNPAANKYLNEWLNATNIRYISSQEFNIILKNSNINFNVKFRKLKKTFLSKYMYVIL